MDAADVEFESVTTGEVIGVFPLLPTLWGIATWGTFIGGIFVYTITPPVLPQESETDGRLHG